MEERKEWAFRRLCLAGRKAGDGEPDALAGMGVWSKRNVGGCKREMSPHDDGGGGGGRDGMNTAQLPFLDIGRERRQCGGELVMCVMSVMCCDELVMRG